MKNSTRRKRKKNHAASSRAALAEALSVVLKHPQTPARLYNAMMDELTELMTLAVIEMEHEASFIERSIELYLRKERSVNR